MSQTLAILIRSVGLGNLGSAFLGYLKPLCLISPGCVAAHFPRLLLWLTDRAKPSPNPMPAMGRQGLLHISNAKAEGPPHENISSAPSTPEHLLETIAQSSPFPRLVACFSLTGAEVLVITRGYGCLDFLFVDDPVIFYHELTPRLSSYFPPS